MTTSIVCPVLLSIGSIKGVPDSLRLSSSFWQGDRDSLRGSLGVRERLDVLVSLARKVRFEVVGVLTRAKKSISPMSIGRIAPDDAVHDVVVAVAAVYIEGAFDVGVVGAIAILIVVAIVPVEFWRRSSQSS